MYIDFPAERYLGHHGASTSLLSSLFQTVDYLRSVLSTAVRKHATRPAVLEMHRPK